MTDVYPLSIFENVSTTGFDYRLPNDIIACLSRIHDKCSNTPSPYKILRFNKLVFQSTKPILHSTKSTGSNAEGLAIDHHTEMLLVLNKISNKTYLDSIDTIIGLFKTAPESIADTLDAAVLNVFTTNRFYVTLYADVFSLCVQHRPSLLECLDRMFVGFIETLSNIETVDPNVDYDLFCANNVKHEKQKTMSAFILKITQNSIIPSSYVTRLVEVLLLFINQYIQSNQHAYVVDELIEHVVIVYNKEYLSENHIQQIKHITLYKPKQFPGLSSRSIFKLMDIV